MTKTKTNKIASALDRLAAALAAEGVKLPRNRLRNVAAAVAGCRNDNEYVSRSAELYPAAERIETIRDCYGRALHVLRDPRSDRLYAVDDASLAAGQRRIGLLQPCPYGGMIDIESALLPPPAEEAPLSQEQLTLPAFRFHLTRAATETASVEVRARTVEEAFEKAQDREFWSDPRNADFRLDEGNWPERPYIPDEDDYEMVPAGEM